jgi:hypothetical protein
VRISARAFVLLLRAGHFLLRGQEKSYQREGHPTWHLPGYARQVREPRPGFSIEHRATAPALPQLQHPCPRLSVRKGADIHVDSRYAACRPRLTAAQWPRIEQSDHRGPHSVRSRVAAAKRRDSLGIDSIHISAAQYRNETRSEFQCRLSTQSSRWRPSGIGKTGDL